MNGKSVPSQQFWKLSLLAVAVLCGPAFVKAADQEAVGALFTDDNSSPSFVPPAPTDDAPQLTAFQFEPAPAPPVEGSEPTQSTVPGTPIKPAKPMSPAAPMTEPPMMEYQQEMTGFPGGDVCCNNECCDSVIDGCCDCLGKCNEPSWTASVGAIYLRRERGDDTNLVTGTVGPLNAREFDFEYEVGYVVDVSRHNGMKSFQLRHFGIDGWNDSINRTDPGAGSGLFIPVGSIGGNNSNGLQFRYTSEMFSTEANWMGENCSRFTPIVGARWIRFSERLHYSDILLGTQLTPYFEIDTLNDLYGGQLGGSLALIEGERLQVSALGKVGAYANQARHRFKNRLPSLAASSVPGEALEANRTTTSIVYEAGLNGALKLTDNISIAGGYMMMWLSQLALSPSQIERNNPYPGLYGPTAKNIDTGDYVIVHGGELNLTIEW